MRRNVVRSVADMFVNRKPARRRPIRNVRLAVEEVGIIWMAPPSPCCPNGRTLQGTYIAGGTENYSV